MLREISDKREWDGILSAAPVPSGRFLQSWEWGEFQQFFGRKVFHFAEADVLAQAIELPLPGGMKYWFVPKGPVAANGTWQMGRGKWDVARDFMEGLKQEAAKAGAIFLRVEPENVLPGGIKSRDISPAATSVVDLADSEEEILARMHPKTRYNIRVAERHKVRVSAWASHKVPFEKIFALFEETSRRDGFRLHPRAYYERQIGLDSVRAYGAELGGELLSAAIVINDGGMGTYLHGASSNEKRNVMAPYVLHWEIMKALKAQGCTAYDLWGISNDPKSSWAGISRFKRGWGGREVAAPGTFDLPIKRFWYSVYRLARRLKP